MIDDLFIWMLPLCAFVVVAAFSVSLDVKKHVLTLPRWLIVHGRRGYRHLRWFWPAFRFSHREDIELKRIFKTIDSMVESGHKPSRAISMIIFNPGLIREITDKPKNPENRHT